jgi:hypothetical protein
MEITTFKPEKYRDCWIYYRNFNKHFEYLTIVEDQLYTAHVSVKPHWATKVLYLVGIEKMLYSKQQLGKILGRLRMLAATTIDFVLDKEKMGEA